MTNQAKDRPPIGTLADDLADNIFQSQRLGIHGSYAPLHEQYPALRITLATLIAEMRQGRIDVSTRDELLLNIRMWADRLVLLLDEVAPHLCPDCDHGVVGGKPCETCGGSGYAR